MRPFILIFMFFLISCASSASVNKESGRSFIVNDRSYSEDWNAAILTVSSVGAIESENKFLGEVRGLRGASAWSWGDAIAVFIDPPQNDARRFTVTVVSEHIMQTQISGQDFKGSMIATMKAHLKLYD